MLSIMERNAALDEYAGPGHWNDPDILEVGNGGMTDVEYLSHFGLWSTMAAPLLTGADLREVGPEVFEILRNGEVTAVNQDPPGSQGTVLSHDSGRWVFTQPLADGDVAVTLFNENPYPATISTTAEAGRWGRDGQDSPAPSLPTSPGRPLSGRWLPMPATAPTATTPTGRMPGSAVAK